jgi:hypothetical protein
MANIRSSVRDLKPRVIVLDDADLFGDQAGPLLAQIASENPDAVVLSCIRNTRFFTTQIGESLSSINHSVVKLPLLDDADISLLVDALSRGNRLGRLLNLERSEQEAAFRNYFGRQLLVALIETTLGVSFSGRVASEFDDLPSDLQHVYAIAAVATDLNQFVTIDEVMLAVGAVDNATLDRIGSLIDMGLLMESSGRLRVRHRVVARQLVRHLRLRGMLREPIRGLVYAVSLRYGPLRARRSREFKFLVEIMNHEWLKRMTSVREARHVYVEIEALLKDNYHYWLQRGSLEVEPGGDLQRAQLFLAHAEQLAPPGAVMVAVEQSYLLLRQACTQPMAPDAIAKVVQGLEGLDKVFDTFADAGVHGYHIYGRQGLEWSRVANLKYAERKDLLEQVRSRVRDGMDRYPSSVELRRLDRQLQREYLMLAARPRFPR